MSLPPAPKDISTHPVRGSVTDPVDKDKMHADVDRKLRFYGVIQAFRAGRMPDNAQIDDTLRYVADRAPVDTHKLSPQGRRLVDDVRKIIETARQIVKEKNRDELFQNFVWHSRRPEGGVDAGAPRVGDRISAEKAKSNGQQAAHHLRTLLSLLLTNSEARKLLSDLSLIGRDLLARAVLHIRPSDEALKDVDAPAANNNFPSHERGKTANAPETGAEGTAEHPVPPVSSDTTNGGGTSGVSTDAQKEKQSFKERIVAHLPSEVREKAGKAKDYLAEEYFPKERRERFIYRGKKVILECQKHDDYQKSMTWLLDTLSDYVEHGRDAAREGKDGVKGLWEDENLRQATDELLTLLTRFADNKSTVPIREAVDRLAEDAREDEELRTWGRRVKEWGRRILLESGYVLEKSCNEDGVALREDGRKFYDDKYKAHFDGLFDAIGDWSKAFTTDPLNTRFGEDWARLTRELLFDTDGKNLVWKQELWDDVRRVIVPEVVDKVGYIPIPRAEYTDENLDFVVENLTLSGKNMFPNIVSVEAHNYVKFSPYASIPDEARHEVVLTLGQIQADMRDVLFSFHKKTGVPKMRDSGLADILLTGTGITVIVRLLSPPKGDTSSVFRVGSIRVKVGGLKFRVRESRHDAVYKMFGPLATRIVKRQLKKAVSDAVRVGLEWVDEGLVRVRERMEEAKEEEGVSRTEALKELFKRHTDEAKEKQERRHSQFKVVAKRDSMLLPEEGHLQGWVNKPQEKAEIAREGEEWRSKAFTIVSETRRV